MILEQKQTNVLVTGEDSSKKATINQDKIAKLQYLLTKGLYSDPISATIVELTNNAVDAVVASGKDPIEHPVIVSITDSLLSIEDKGIGLNKEEFENVVMNYLTSTKEDDNQAIGYFGIGSKSFLSLERSATFICRKNGIEYKFLCYQGEEFLEYDLVYEKQTQEENGVRVEIKINDYFEKKDFINKALKKLSYYDTVLLYIGGELTVNKIIRNKHWQHSSNCGTQFMHFCLKDVYYEIDWNKLGLNRIDMPIALRFDLDSGITPTPSRESILYTSETIELLKRKIETVANWFVEKYNEEVKEYDTILDAWKEFNKHSKYVELRDKIFFINSIIKYATEVPKEFSVKNLPDARYFHNKVFSILNNYHYVGYSDYYGNLYKKNIGVWKADFLIDNTSFTVIVNEVPSRNVKSFLLEKYEGKKIHYLVPPKENKRRFKPEKGKLHDEFCYWDILNLNNVSKSSWSTYIRQFNLVEEQFKSKLIDETQVETSKEFLQWKENKKQERKSKPRNVDSNYVVLDKKEDEYTLAICRKSSFYNKFAFDKRVEKVHSSSKNNFLTVYFDESEREKAEFYYRLINKSKIRIAIIGKRERLKIQNNHNFMTPEQFEKSKPFRRLVTAIKFDSLLDKHRKLKRNSNEIIQKFIPSLQEDINKLRIYVEKNYESSNSAMTQAVMDLAESQNLWDYEFMDVYNRVEKELSQFEFLQYLETPSYWDEKSKKAINSIITKMLYHQKTFRGMHENIEITIKNEENVAA